MYSFFESLGVDVIFVVDTGLGDRELILSDRLKGIANVGLNDRDSTGVGDRELILSERLIGVGVF